MKVIAIILAVAAAVSAVPTGSGATCTPATYACAKNPTTNVEGWKVCDVSGTWVYAGDCPPNTACQFYAINGSPYCIPVAHP